MAYYSPYGLQGMRGMRPQMYGMQAPKNPMDALVSMPSAEMMAKRNVMQPQGQRTFTPSDKRSGTGPQPNYPMYGRNPYNTPGVRPLYEGTTWQNFRGGRQGPPSMYGGLGSYGNMMGGYGGGGMYGGGMGGMYGGGGMPGYGDPRMLSRPSPERPPPGVPGFNPPGQYGSPLTNQFQYGLMGANPAAYSQSLRQMGYFQPQMPAQTDLQNLMGYQQASFNPYLTGPTTTPDPNTTTGAATTGAATTGAATTGAATTTQAPYATTTQGYEMYGMGGYGGGMPMMGGYGGGMPMMMGGYGGGMPMMMGGYGGYGGGLGSMYRNYPIY
jgi:hypothetical protein